MNNLDKQYTDLLQDILDNGVRKEDRTGTGTISVFGRQIRHKMSEGFPVLTTKKMAFKTMVTELLWFLRGDTNIKFLVDNDCHIWDGDAYKAYWNVVTFEKPDYFHEKHGHLKMSVKKEGDNYLPLTQEEFINRIKTDDKFTHWGDLGKIYGSQWRSWKAYRSFRIEEGGGDYSIEHRTSAIDQIANLINDLKTNPDSRRLMVNAWNVADLDSMTLPPCHYGFQVYTRELSWKERYNMFSKEVDGILTEEWADEIGFPKRAISLMWSQRSCDSFLGLPFNIASYGLLLEIIAKAVNMVPDELIGNLGDTHLYLNHIEQAKEQIGRELSLEERKEIYEKEYTEGIKIQNDEWLESKLKTRDIPTRTREPYLLPKLFINDEFWNHDYQTIDGWINSMETGDFRLENYQSHPAIKAPLNN
jgi:thymidylate synthase